MNITEVEFYTTPELLEKAYNEGYEIALDRCVVDCFTNSLSLPEWAVLGLVERSNKIIEKDLKKTIKKKRFHSLVVAAVKAAEDSGIASGDSRFSVAESLLSITNVKSKQGADFGFDNIKKIYNRNEKNETRLVHADAWAEFMLIIENLPKDISTKEIKEIETLILKTPEIKIEF